MDDPDRAGPGRSGHWRPAPAGHGHTVAGAGGPGDPAGGAGTLGGMDELVDVVVLGLGPGGEEVAGRLATAGLSVVGVDGGLVGGECPYWGCVPSKMMIRAADLLAEGRRIPGMAGASTVTPDWGPVARRIREEATDDWDDTVAVERLEGKGARFVRGLGPAGRPRAGGGRRPGPRGPPGRGGQHRGQAVVPADPRAGRHPVLDQPGGHRVRDAPRAHGGARRWGHRGGAGPGVLPASAPSVTVVEAADRLLAAEEPESSALVDEVFGAEGIGVVTGAAIVGVAHEDGRFTLRIDGAADVVGERLLVATGRRPDLAAVGVATVGLDEGARALAVDDTCRVAPGVWAIGDMTGKGAFTHVSMYQAAIVVADILAAAGRGTGAPVPRATTGPCPG